MSISAADNALSGAFGVGEIALLHSEDEKIVV
jgi:hypothetical protein